MVTTKARAAFAVIGFALLGACSDEDLQTVAPDSSGRRAHVLSVDSKGRLERAVRIDGSIAWVSPTPTHVTAAEPQYLVATGTEGGTDQNTLLVMTASGERIAAYRFPWKSPFPQPDDWKAQRFDRAWHQAVPSVGKAIPFSFRGRRFVAAASRSLWGRSVLALVEATSRQSLLERATFWNVGSISSIGVSPSGRFLVIWGVNNSMRDHSAPQSYYPLFLATFDLDRLLNQDQAPPGQSPTGLPPHQSRGHGYDYYHSLSPLSSREVVSRLTAPSVTDTTAVLSVASGVTFRFSLLDGSVKVMIDTLYQRAYERKRARRPQLPSYAEHVRFLKEIETTGPITPRD